MTDRIEQIHAYLGSEASDEECRRLEAWMKEDESHVDIFVNEALLHYRLREALREELSTPAPLDDKEDRLSCDGAGGTSTATAPYLPNNDDLPPGMAPQPGSSVFRICGNAFSAWPVPIFGLLIFVVLGVGGLYFGFSGSPLRNDGCNSPQASVTPKTSMPVSKANDVATVEELSECTWENPQGGSTISGERVSLGRLLNLREGKARVKFDCGAVVTIGGPALMKIDSDMDATLHHGDLSVIVPDEARGFLVHTSEMDIRDLGTEFTLSLDNRGQTQLEVVEGEVEASFASKNNNIETKKHSLKTGEYLHANRSSLDGDEASQYLNVFRGVRVDFTNMQGLHLLEIVNEDKNRYRHDPVNQCLSVDTSWGSVWGNASRSKGEGGNLFLLPAPKLKDFDVILSVASFVPERLSEHVGLLVLDDADNFTRMIYAMGTDHEGTYLKFNVERDGDPGPEVRESASFGNDSFQLRMSRRGSEISSWWTRDGSHWNLCGRSTKQQSISQAGFYVSKGHPYPKCSTPYQQALIEEIRIEIKD